MRNPGLETFSTTTKQSSPPPMATPFTLTDNYGPKPEPATITEDVRDAPPLKGGPSSGSVGVDNGGEGADPTLHDPPQTGTLMYRDLAGYRAHYQALYRQAGLGETMFSAPKQQHANPQGSPVAQQLKQKQDDAAEQTKITEEQAGVHTSPEYAEAQRQVNEKVHLRHAHPLHQAHTVEAHHDPDADIKSVMDIQGSDGNWDADPYMHGMFNGMELIRSIHDGDDPEFREAPEHWGCGHEKEAAVDHQLDVRDYDGTEGNNTHITRGERGMIPLDWVRNMPGARGEVPGQHRLYDGDEWEQFKESVAGGEPGYSDPIFITVDHGQHPMINEGNHRRDAYAEMRHTHVPAEIRYFGHAEREGTVGDRAMRHSAAFADETDDPRGELEGMINDLPQQGSGRRVLPSATHDQKSQLAELGYGQHWDDPHSDDTSYWLRTDGQGRERSLYPTFDGWATAVDGFDEQVHPDFEHALGRLKDTARQPGQTEKFQLGGQPDPRIESMSSVQKQGETDDEFWERQPDVIWAPGSFGPDSVAAGPEMDEWAQRGFEDHERPRGIQVHEHDKLGEHGFKYDGNDRFPGYYKSVGSQDPDGSWVQAQHLIERNPGVEHGDIDQGTGGRDSLGFPWSHTYIPPGGTEAHALHRGHNSFAGALGAASTLSLYGPEHPRGQAALEGYGAW